jgi:phytoene dehydrogenase-like protein
MSAPVVVIGAGANELVAAHYLARAGHRVVVLDLHDADPGATVGWFPPRIARELGIAQGGLHVERADPWAAAALPDGGRLELWRDMARSSSRSASQRAMPTNGPTTARDGAARASAEALYARRRRIRWRAARRSWCASPAWVSARGGSGGRE